MTGSGLTAHDTARIYRYILTRLPAQQRQLIVGALAAAPRIAADGWDQYFGIPSGMPTPWAIKQGWSNSGGDKVMHSTGLIGPTQRYIVVLLIQDDLTTSWHTLRRAITAAAHTTAPLIRDTVPHTW